MKKFFNVLGRVFPFIIVTIVTILIERLFDFSAHINLPIGILVICTFILVSLVIFVISEKNRKIDNIIIENRKKLDELKSRYEKIIAEKEEEFSKVSAELCDARKALNNHERDMGTHLLTMAFTQNLYEPLKYIKLEEAVYKYKNVFAAFYLADIYSNGIEYKGKVFIKQEKEKAAEIYKEINEYDEYGVSDWMLGWYYQQKIINDAKTNPEHMKIAKDYYSSAMKKGFPKGFNSIGNFTLHNWAKDNEIAEEEREMEALKYYTAASEKGDIYGVLNKGNYYNTKFKSSKNICDLNNAIHYYKVAADKNSVEGLVKLGICKELIFEIENDRTHLDAAIECYIKSFTYTNSDNQFSASGYSRLGLLINRYPQYKIGQDNKVIECISPMRFDDPAIECLVRSYEMFQKIMVMDNSKKAKGEFMRYYQELIDGFKSFK